MLLKKLLNLFLLSFVSISLIACQSIDRPHRVKVEGDGYSVEVKDQGYHQGGYPRHCPPGHAKKGWCDYD